MLRKLIALLLICAMPSTVFALASSAAPTKIQIPFANSAGGAYVRTVPIASQIGIQNGAASYTDGFPPLNFTPVSAGGVPPFGQDMNGILRDVSAHARWWAAGGPVRYDGTYQTAIGGYPLGAIVQSATVTGKLWVSTAENNATNPDTGGAGWIPALNTVYAPLTGTGASGTWGISITGNAATATSATSATSAGTSGTFTITATGFTATLTATATWYVNNSIVHLTLPYGFSNGTSNATTFTLTGLPAAIQPASQKIVGYLYGVDNGSPVSVQARIGGAIPAGTISLLTSAGLWTSSGQKWLPTTEISYSLN